MNNVRQLIFTLLIRNLRTGRDGLGETAAVTIENSQGLGRVGLSDSGWFQFRRYHLFRCRMVLGFIGLSLGSLWFRGRMGLLTPRCAALGCNVRRLH
jgi:hypothetical protein